ncbi:hypothetical protein Btru_045443 [Bulinus truncatus]|nr:hypothetical protein Btru_045443 [Bulinus truncatus]
MLASNLNSVKIILDNSKYRMKTLQLALLLLCTISVSCRGTRSDSDEADSDEKIKRSKRNPDSCKDVTRNQSRVVVTLSSGLEVMCDTETDGGGWTIFQRRINGQLSFYRGWEDYKYGFGDYSSGEFYLGNENIHRITTKRRYELRIDFTFRNVRYFAKYSRFRLYGEPEGYRLKISGYSGNAGDNLSIVNDVRFSAFDRGSTSCASNNKGAWWYNSCQVSNLNGIWGSTSYSTGMNWYSTTGYYSSVTMSEMKFRQVS